MTPLPNSEIVAGIAENMEDKLPTYSSSFDATTILDNLRTNNATSRNGVNDKLDLHNESDRLRTFETWTVPFIDKRDLVDAGFYYTEISDIVRCPYCELELGRWVSGDDPLSDHRKHAPACKFVLQKTSKCSPQVPPPDESPSSVGEDLCGPYRLENDKSPTRELERRARNTMLEKLKINTSNIPMYPAYSTNEDRLKTFENWPISSKIPPDSLSMAGFVYTQNDDRTFCFHCGGSLYSWDDYDEPWIEHAHWFPKCKFVLSMRGQKFIDDARTKKHEDLMRTSEEMKNAIETIKGIFSAVDVNTVTNNKNIKESSSEGNSSNDESINSQDTETSSSSHSIDEGLATCLICLAEKRNTVLLPCYHVVGCAGCVKKLRNCCVCREPIICRRRLYFS